MVEVVLERPALFGAFRVSICCCVGGLVSTRRLWFYTENRTPCFIAREGEDSFSAFFRRGGGGGLGGCSKTPAISIEHPIYRCCAALARVPFFFVSSAVKNLAPAGLGHAGTAASAVSRQGVLRPPRLSGEGKDRSCLDSSAPALEGLPGVFEVGGPVLSWCRGGVLDRPSRRRCAPSLPDWLAVTCWRGILRFTLFIFFLRARSWCGLVDRAGCNHRRTEEERCSPRVAPADSDVLCVCTSSSLPRAAVSDLVPR